MGKKLYVGNLSYEVDSSALEAWAWTQKHLIVSLLVDVASRLEVHTPTETGWQHLTMWPCPRTTPC